jgi:sec-independent protein translocase protein TatB
LFGVSFGELIIIALVALLLFGPEKLPEFARSFGSFMAKFNSALESVQQEFNKGLEEAEAAAAAAAVKVEVAPAEDAVAQEPVVDATALPEPTEPSTPDLPETGVPKRDSLERGRPDASAGPSAPVPGGNPIEQRSGGL